MFKRYRLRKMVKHLLREARHARHMREDITSKEKIDGLLKAEQAFRSAYQSQDGQQIEKRAQELMNRIVEVYPRRRHGKIRENIEIVVVALAVAMGFRTYFIQPFKIPTGSMQPTLYGIVHKAQDGRSAMDRFPLNLMTFFLFGEKYSEVTSKVTGYIDPEYDENEEYFRIKIAGQEHLIDKNLARHFEPGSFVRKGAVLATGRVKRGDHIFVNKVKYNFVRPKRGDIVVFSTENITDPRVRKNSYYIKRLAGLPGEQISIDPPYLVVNGKRIDEPSPFKRILHDEAYDGYALARKMAKEC